MACVVMAHVWDGEANIVIACVVMAHGSIVPNALNDVDTEGVVGADADGRKQESASKDQGEKADTIVLQGIKAQG